MSLFDDDMDDTFDGDDFASDFGASMPVVDTLQSPNQSSFFLGHDDVEKDVLDLWHSGRMPHAVIFNGLKGVGKATFAYRLARFILRESARDSSAMGLFGGEESVQAETMDIPMDDPIYNKVASGGHPDFRSFELPFDDAKGVYKKEIPVDEIRKIAPFLRQSSADGGWRVVIIDDANTMGRSGQNAILKILEEPPKNTILILVTHGAGGMLPTIRSRCRFVSFDTLSNDNMKAIMEKSSSATIMPNDADLITALAKGSAGRAVSLIENGDIGSLYTIIEVLNDLSRIDDNRLNDIALAYGKSGDQKVADQFIDIAQWWLDELVYMAANNTRAKYIGHVEMRLPQSATLQTMLMMKDNVQNHIESSLRGTLDKRYIIFKILRLMQGG